MVLAEISSPQIIEETFSRILLCYYQQYPSYFYLLFSWKYLGGTFRDSTDILYCTSTRDLLSTVCNLSWILYVKITFNFKKFSMFTINFDKFHFHLIWNRTNVRTLCHSFKYLRRWSNELDTIKISHELVLYQGVKHRWKWKYKPQVSFKLMLWLTLFPSFFITFNFNG